MKKQDIQILAMLQAFNQAAVLKAFELYRTGIENNNQKTKQKLEADGWFPQKEKPTDREFYFFEKAYWVQSQEMRDKQIKEQIEAMKRRKTSAFPATKKQNMGLKQVNIKCPSCNAKMYKQGVCGGCAEGRKGYKIRLICEENPDHEVLL